MRPQVLFPLFASVRSLPGVGAKIAPAVERVAGPRVVDLLWHLPTGAIDRRYAPTIADAEPGRIATVTVKVGRHLPPASRKHPYKVQCFDGTGMLTLVFFHAYRDYLERLLPAGATRVVSGMIEAYGSERQMTHPDRIVEHENRDRILTVDPVYALTAGLTLKTVAKIVRAAVSLAPVLDEWLDPQLVKRKGWPAWREALTLAHAPQHEAELSPTSRHRSRLAYDEILANQLALAIVRKRIRHGVGRSIRGNGQLTERALNALSFRLTPSQQRALGEITADMASEKRMLRLLQGDVGSGKTVLAVLAMLGAVESGAQAALMAPTEILAKQHMMTITPLAGAADVPIAVLTGRDKGRARDLILSDIAEGRSRLVIGTHALFQESVAFKDLALAVIDEQHRFGVHQRLDLAQKGRSVDVLVMTATPIPRTLVLTTYGDMDVSRISGKPPGRQPVTTRTVSVDRIDDVAAAVGRSLATGGKVYWVCPLVEESEALDVAAAEERFQHLRGMFGERVGLLHGRMKGADKDAVMAAFAEGGVDVLVATTVIEVGIDVPAATVMVIEHAERFGLAQLHQLRGRIGRGSRPSTCLLLYDPRLSEAARARLSIMRETDDGFRIAEEDLKLRGAGEVLGTRQSGMPEFRLADLSRHADLLALAQDDARLIVERDPDLTSPRGKALRVLLYLFERDAAVRYLRSG
jgi:ATP-dependent DNA helicase RecG